ncbi:hypothetical protein TNCV_629841 [Trichonephila clavipes]|nr:hypothetical protein TNCV_629841 [Trichonephila clavipes]
MCIGQALKGIYVLFPTHRVDARNFGVTDLFVNDVTREVTNRETSYPNYAGLFTKTDKSTAAKTNVKHRIFTGDHAPKPTSLQSLAD